MAHNDLEARIQASNLMLSLLRIFSHCPEDSHKKEFLIQYDVATVKIMLDELIKEKDDEAVQAALNRLNI
jgi:hypothetical protein